MYTPLHLANGSIDMVRLLLENGADIHVCSRIGTTSLHHIRLRRGRRPPRQDEQRPNRFEAGPQGTAKSDGPVAQEGGLQPGVLFRPCPVTQLK
ncbi:MAG: ankyrin repeat domain-containing protein [Armatimonadetes bacterium]|nr:ankyrin repeat domain-containing protein [Armatimonadota bacterium]